MASEFEIPIGRLVMNFGALELNLMIGIAALVAEDPSVGRAVAGPLRFNDRLRVIDALIRSRIALDDPLIPVLSGVISELSNVAKRRNEIVHAPWIDVPGSDIDKVKSVFNSSPKIGKGLVETTIPVTPAQIADLSNAVFEANGHYRRLMEDLGSRNLLYKHTGSENETESENNPAKSIIQLGPTKFQGNSVSVSASDTIHAIDSCDAVVLKANNEPQSKV